MTSRRTEDIIDALALDAAPVKPLRPPLHRAAMTLGMITLAGGLAVLLFATADPFQVRGEDPRHMVLLEMLAILATGVLAVAAAFQASIPGRSRMWLLAPLPPLALWLMLSGLGCYADLAAGGSLGSVHSDCLLFIIGVSALLALPLVWPLARARPLETRRVALMTGLALAALAAFLLQFFHAFEVTFVDLGVHLLGFVLVVACTSLFGRRALRPA